MKSTPPSSNVPERYIEDVLSGKITTSTWVKKAIQRHTRELAGKTTSPIQFDRNQAIRPIRFIEGALHHTSDSGTATSGKPFKLEPWQQALLWILFGWRRTDTGQRRFRTAYLELARGNGKSKLASAIALYALVGEGVAGSEVYSVATTRDQSKIVFDDAVLMTAKSPALTMLKHFKNNLHVPGTASKFMPLASEESTLDGLKPNLIVVDELHAHKTKGVWTKCKTAMGKKPGSLMFAITTAGWDRHSICYEQREYSQQVLSGFEDDSYFAWICCLDPEDDPFDENNWYKSNPNLDVSIERQTLRDAAKQAQSIPSEYNEFLRMRCSLWTESETRWVTPELWDSCNEPFDATSLLGKQCFAGLDLSVSQDLSALVLLFPPQDGIAKWTVLPHLWVPADSVQERVQKDRVPYDRWITEGLIKKTAGNIIDYHEIYRSILDLADRYKIVEVCYDPYHSLETATKLEAAGLTVVPIQQRYPILHAPTRKLEELLLERELRHAGHKVLRWNAMNCVVTTSDGGDLRKLDKSRSRDRIDAMAALINALARAMIVPLPTTSNFFFFVA